MTTAPTASRWWNPAGPHIGPDETDIGMLAATGENPRLDLGAALLAAHRVGAAACDAAAATPLVDERTLIRALAAAREQLANPMIDSVSKSVEGERYACVLVCDVLDDAEEAALDIFRSAVSRGVAPPLAAARAGAVFGVSKDAIGKYRQKATDPRVNPVALADEADRTLFGFVEKLAAEETDEREEVSKITPSERRRRAEEENRDRRGRFAVAEDNPTLSVSNLLRTEGHTEAAPQTEVGDSEIGVGQPGLLARMRSRYGFGGGSTPSRVGETVEEVAIRQQQAARAQQAEKARKARAAREARRKRNAPPKPVLAPTGRTAQPRAALDRGALQRGAVDRGAVSRKSDIARAVRERLGVAEDYTTPDVGEITPVTSNLDWTRLADASYTPHGDRLIDTEVGVALPGAQGRRFAAEIAGRKGNLLRIGELTQLAGGNNVEEVTNQRGDAYEDVVENTARGLEERQPNAVHIGDDHRVFEGARSEMEIENRLHVMAADISSSEEGIATPYPDHFGHGYHMVFQPAEGGDVPQIYEFVIEDAVGHTTSDARHPQWTLDPNQYYAMNDAMHWDTTYDDRGFKRTRITLTPVSEEEARRYIIGKADTSDERRARVANEPRNDLGQWMRNYLARQAPEVAPAEPDRRADLAHRANLARHARERRAKARQRQTQPTEPIRVAAPRQALGRKALDRKAQQRLSPIGRQRIQRVQRQVKEAFATRRTLSRLHEFNFDPHSEYAVLSNTDWGDLITRTGADYANAEVVHVVGRDSRHFVENTAVRGLDAPEAVAEAYEMDEIRGEEPMQTTKIAMINPGSDEEAGGMAAVTEDLLDRPEVSAVHSKPDNEDANLMHISVNKHRPQPIWIVELDPDLLDTPSTLEIGEHPSAVVSHEALWDDGSATTYSVPVMFYRQVPLHPQQRGQHRSPGRNREGGR